MLNLTYNSVNIIVEGKTNQSFKKLILSAPMLGTIKLSLIDLRVPKLKSMHSIINAIGTKSFISERLIGQKISEKLGIKVPTL